MPETKENPWRLRLVDQVMELHDDCVWWLSGRTNLVNQHGSRLEASGTGRIQESSFNFFYQTSSLQVILHVNKCITHGDSPISTSVVSLCVGLEVAKAKSKNQYGRTRARSTIIDMIFVFKEILCNLSLENILRKRRIRK